MPAKTGNKMLRALSTVGMLRRANSEQTQLPSVCPEACTDSFGREQSVGPNKQLNFPASMASTAANFARRQSCLFLYGGALAELRQGLNHI